MWARLVKLPYQWVMGRVVLWFAQRTRFGGFTVYDGTQAGLDAGILETLERALELIREATPSRHERMLRDMPAITVADDQQLEYVYVMRSAFLPRSLVAGRPHVTIAAVLAGLGARARAANLIGGSIVDPVTKGRILQLDIRAQRSFISSLDPERFTNLDGYLDYLDRFQASLAQSPDSTAGSAPEHEV